jgi:hypothetical protein
METSYKNLSYFFAGIFAVAIIGFFNSYFGLFPYFKGLPDMAHLHFIGWLLWFALLIIQPLLIRFNKLPTHRLLGRFSYFLAPYILFTIVGMIKYSYSIHKTHYLIATDPPGLYFSLAGAINFSLFYVLAIVYKKNTAYHMRYIIVSSLALLPPSTGRFFSEELKLGNAGGVFTPLIVLLIIIGLIIYDKIKLKRVSKPYIIALLFTLALDISIPTFIPTHAWHILAFKIGQFL